MAKAARRIGQDVLAQRSRLILREQAVSDRAKSQIDKITKQWVRDLNRVAKTATEQTEQARRAEVLFMIGQITKAQRDAALRIASRVRRDAFRVERARYSEIVGRSVARSRGGSLAVSFAAIPQRQVRALLSARIPGSQTIWNIGAQAERRARSLLAKSLAESVPLREIVPQLRTIIQSTSNEVASLARTTLMAASNEAAIESYRDSGRVVGLRWNATFDTRTCPVCASNHNREFPIDDAPAIPAHPGCRCVWVPVFGNANVDRDVRRASQRNPDAGPSSSFSQWLRKGPPERRADFFPSIIKRAAFESRVASLDKLVHADGTSTIDDSDLLDSLSPKQRARVERLAAKIRGG